MITRVAALACCGLLVACASSVEAPPRHPAMPDLPIPISNNAVASIERDGQVHLYSFMGLTDGKTAADISSRAFALRLGDAAWTELPFVPVIQGRLASIAAAVGEAVYLFGGYTVAEDGHEVSTPEVLRFDPASRRYTAVAPMPIPVDDTVALVWRARWIVLVSGWHHDRNVAAVQFYDTQTDRWTAGTAFPGTPVFGHAGAIVGDSAVICDGVRLEVRGEKREFSASAECWRADFDDREVGTISWTRIAPHGGLPRYRMGAASVPRQGGAQLVFAGGSERPYNFNGIGYDGQPAAASARIDGYDLASADWERLPDLTIATMDHRGALPLVDGLILVGGMRDPQRVSAGVVRASVLDGDR